MSGPLDSLPESPIHTGVKFPSLNIPHCETLRADQVMVEEAPEAMLAGRADKESEGGAMTDTTVRAVAVLPEIVVQVSE